MKRSRSNGLCCGAGGAQMFKEPEKGRKDLNIERTEEALATGASVVATACPFCMTMIRDGMKQLDKEQNVRVLDIAENTTQEKRHSQKRDAMLTQIRNIGRKRKSH